MAIVQETRVSWYENVSTLYFIGDKDGGVGGDNWSSKSLESTLELLLMTKPEQLQLIM